MLHFLREESGADTAETEPLRKSGHLLAEFRRVGAFRSTWSSGKPKPGTYAHGQWCAFASPGGGCRKLSMQASVWRMVHKPEVFASTPTPGR